jgi:diadenosine tetraphosphate (Ap4A) HIT family hydrolase
MAHDSGGAEVDEFKIDPRLAADTAFIADWTLSRVLLMNDSRFPWLILVPRRAGLVEVFDLDAAGRSTLIEEVSRAAERLKRWARADKINIGALGNIVPQLHVHVVARRRNDAAGLAPMWGFGQAVPYTEQELARLLSELRSAL